MLYVLGIILIALAPCAFWLWLTYRGDKYAPEPKWLIIRTFLMGMAIAIPVSIIETLLYPGAIDSSMGIAAALYVSFIVAGVTEEVGKFLVVRRGIYNNPHFEEPSDGLVYTAAAALGLAFLENVFYLLSFGWEIILIRGMFSNLAHVLFSILWGYPLALSKLGIIKHRSVVWLGLVGAILAHGIFDFLLFIPSAFSFLLIPFFAGMVAAFILMMRHANRISIYAVGKEE